MGRLVDLLTKAAIKEMVIPSLFQFFTNYFIFNYFFNWWTRSCIISSRSNVVRSNSYWFIVAISMTAGGGAWDNAKKYIEDGNFGGKGSEAHKAAVTGDTVGDPYKDTAGPAVNPMIKITNIVALLLLSVIAH